METAQTDALPPYTPPPGEPPPSRGLGWGLLLALLVLLVAGLGGLVGWIVAGRTENGGTVAVTQTLSGTTQAQVRVPDVLGIKADAAVARLAASGLQSEKRFSPGAHPTGHVLKQDPPGGTTVDKDTAVLLVIDSKGRGAATVKVPSVTGQRVSDAQERLRTAGLESLVFVVPSPEPRGRVIAQNPKADSKLGRGKPVRLNVSAGTSGATTTTATTTVTTPTTSRTTTTSTTTTAARAVVPNVVGLDESTAVTRFQQAGLKASVVRVPSSEPEGTVVAQAKQPGTSLPRGSTFQINVSAG